MADGVAATSEIVGIRGRSWQQGRGCRIQIPVCLPAAVRPITEVPKGTSSLSTPARNTNPSLAVLFSIRIARRLRSAIALFSYISWAQQWPPRARLPSPSPYESALLLSGKQHRSRGTMTRRCSSEMVRWRDCQRQSSTRASDLSSRSWTRSACRRGFVSFQVTEANMMPESSIPQKTTQFSGSVGQL